MIIILIQKNKLKPHQITEKPVSIDYKNILELYENRKEKNPDKTFLIFPGQHEDIFSYDEFYDEVKKTISYLISNKIKNNDRIALIFSNSPEFIFLYFAGLCKGISIVAINPDLSAEEISYILNDSKPKAVFYHSQLKNKIDHVSNKKSYSFYDIKDFNHFQKTINTFEAKKIDNCGVQPTQEAVIIYTSGTTGHPKGVILTQLNILSDAQAIAKWFNMDESTRTLCILPLFHNNGQIATFMTPLYAGGSSVIVKGKASLMSIWGLIDKYKINWTSVMPSILAILLSLPRSRKDDTMRGIICGGQILTDAVQDAFEHRFNIPIFEGYGLTETTSFSCFNDYPKDERRKRSIGKPFSVNDMIILDEDGKECDPYRIGEICIRGYNVTTGYLNKIQKNKESFPDGWFHSGDYGFVDEDGYFYIKGRKDSLIIKGGENIYPAEIENILYKHPLIGECAVIGIPDELLGQNICAFVKIKKDKVIDENEIKEFCKGKIAKFKQPEKIIIINKLENLQKIPKTHSQKILYRELEEYYNKYLEKK